WVMRSLGYTSIATHPYYADGWSRNRIYDELGFEESTFIDDYPQQDFLRKYITDQEMFEFVLDKLKNREGDNPLFLFGITMQNHGGYTYEGPNYSQTIWLDRDTYEEEYKKAPQYLTCLKETDNAVQYLLKELRYYEEDTIVLMFGDHHPSLGNGFYEDLYGKEFETLDEEVLRYTIPFFIWANFDIEEAEVEGTSINYLSRYLLEAAGIDLPPYYQFLKEMEEYIPAVSAKGYYSKSQGGYLTLEEASGTEADWLNEYAILQYNNLFDEDHRNETFFGRYLPEEKDSILE
ncbi:MAG: LTA synthase family protein, partial [Ruminiclostridium sp.]|nr:LTA synthase family protein [Ruminiclostridium sp.]